MIKNDYYKKMIGKNIKEIKQDDEHIYFITEDNYICEIDKFIPYCACYVGEYIDEISEDGICNGVITNVEENIKGNQKEWYNECEEIVYKGEVTFFFENGKINLKVHGEDNGYYGVVFTMPVSIYKGE